MKSSTNKSKPEARHAVPFVTAVLGACSITKAVLQSHKRLRPDPNDSDKDYRGHLKKMQSLCRELHLDPKGIQGLADLLDLLDQFRAQDRRATKEQLSEGRKLNRRYVEWVFKTFPDMERA